MQKYILIESSKVSMRWDRSPSSPLRKLKFNQSTIIDRDGRDAILTSNSTDNIKLMFGPCSTTNMEHRLRLNHVKSYSED